MPLTAKKKKITLFQEKSIEGQNAVLFLAIIISNRYALALYWAF